MKRKNMTKFDKAVSAAFTGHRFYNFSQQEVIKERLTKAILVAYEHGISNFISGLATGIDLMAAQIVQSMTPSWPERFQRLHNLCCHQVNTDGESRNKIADAMLVSFEDGFGQSLSYDLLL